MDGSVRCAVDLVFVNKSNKQLDITATLSCGCVAQATQRNPV